MQKFDVIIIGTGLQPVRTVDMSRAERIANAWTIVMAQTKSVVATVIALFLAISYDDLK
jgi:hypothetical protein